MSLKTVHVFMKLAGGEWLCAPVPSAVSLIQIKGEFGELGLSHSALIFPGKQKNNQTKPTFFSISEELWQNDLVSTLKIKFQHWSHACLGLCN